RDRQRTFQFPLSRPDVIAIQTDCLSVSWRSIEEDHAPALDRLIPDDAGIATDAEVALVPLEHHAPPRPGVRYREPSAQVLVLHRRLGKALGARGARSHAAGETKDGKDQ